MNDLEQISLDMQTADYFAKPVVPEPQPASESAEELNRALESCVSVPSLDRNTFLWDSERAATLIAAHDAKVKRDLRDAILGEGKA